MQSTKKRVFLSFKSEDKQRVWGLRWIASNPDFDLEFYDESVRVPIDSQNSAYIKQRIKEKIARSSVTVCLISETTHESKWVDWELEESIKKGNTIIAMALKDVERAILPAPIKRLGLTFYPWDHNLLARLIQESQWVT